MKPLLVLLAAVAFAQKPGGPRFEVASVKLLTGRTAYSRNGSPETGRIAFTGVDLKGLIATAYPGHAGGVSGPEWMDSVQYSFSAKMPVGTTQLQYQQMLQLLVRERFSLTFHETSKEISGYELLVAPSGHKLRLIPDATARGYPVLKNGYRWYSSRVGELDYYTFGKCTMRDLANALSLQYTHTPSSVVDRTAIAGQFDFNLELPVQTFSLPPGAPPEMLNASMRGIPLSQVAPQIEKQLGIRVRPAKLVQTAIVVDHAERQPAEN